MNFIDPFSICTGCGNEPEFCVESSSGDYPLCPKCYKKYKKTGKIPAQHLVNHLENMIMACKALKHNN